MNNVKALILCGGPLGLPALRELLYLSNPVALCMPENNGGIEQVLARVLKQMNLPLILVNKKNYKHKLAEAIKQYKPTVGLILTFPFILPPEVFNLPQQGFINFHLGLLPQCRGPQPILWHMLNNDSEAGVTLHKLDRGIDTGPIIMQQTIPIDADDTFGALQTKLAALAATQAANLLKILMFASEVPAKPQNEELAKYYKRPQAADLMINWQSMSAAAIKALANACNPWNKGCGAAIKGRVIGFTEVEVLDEILDQNITPGTIIKLDPENGLQVASSDRKVLKINVFYTEEGFMSGKRLINFGFRPGDFFK